MKTMDNKQVNKAPQKSARLVLQAVTAIARSNANSLCRGLLYEPKVIIPGISEPPVRTLRATIPENERHIFR